MLPLDTPMGHSFSDPHQETVLVVEDDAMTLECLTETIRLMDLTVVAAGDGEHGRLLFEKEQPSLVVTDVCMPKMDGLALTEHIKMRRPECPVIILTGYGDEETAVRALKAGASDFLKKPFQFGDLRATITRSLSLSRARLIEERSFGVLDGARGFFILKNEPELIGGIISYVQRPFEQFLSEGDRLHLRVALQELIINAMEHGNLAISTEEKAEAVMTDTYETLISARLRDPRFQQRRVLVQTSYDFDKKIFQCVIRDGGDGFDWQRFVGGSQEFPTHEGGSGRGIFLAKTLISELAYNEKGNEVTLTFQCPSR